MKDTILTGVRVNEEPTIGNFLGAYKPMIELANSGKYQVNMFVPDLHSFTTPIDHSKLQENIIHGVRYYLAAGLDVESADINVYRQSYIPAHSELTWILDCFTGFGEMRRMTQFKEKSDDISNRKERLGKLSDQLFGEMVNAMIVEQEKDAKELETQLRGVIEEYKKAVLADDLEEYKQTSVTVGLFNYPVLMAADILLYSARYVPVGEDQYQHLEFTRDIAQRMNSKFGELFVVPVATKEQSKIMGRDEGLRIRSLTEPEKKMSKSAVNERSKISLNDDPEVAYKKVMGATTDSVGKIQFDMFNQPGISNLLQMSSMLRGVSLQDSIARWGGETSYGDLKQEVAREVRKFLMEFQAKCAEISDERVLQVLERGEARMRVVAEAKLLEVQRAVGLRG